MLDRLAYIKSVLDALYWLKRGSFLHQIGWFKSYHQKLPITNTNQPLPWFTYSFISFLEKRLHKTMVVFEYGSGNSTFWWAERVSQVISCEHSSEWYNKIKPELPSNVKLLFCQLDTGGDYAHAVANYKTMFDIIVIDGRDRVNCAKNALGALKEDGVIIWDNSDRKTYADGYQYLLDNGYKRLDFTGMGPINTWAWSTSIFYPENNCLGI
jgi:hypothetical protein